MLTKEKYGISIETNVKLTLFALLVSALLLAFAIVERNKIVAIVGALGFVPSILNLLYVKVWRK